MKNLVIIALLLSASAFASKARLEALGEDSFGSQYIDDNRNMFLNAAQIHNHHDFVQFDLGSAAAIDQESTPRATGSYFEKNNGGAVWGVTLGQNSNTANQLRAGGIAATAGAGVGAGARAAATAKVINQNVVDFFYGRDNGSMKWGTRFSYTSSKDENASAGNYDETSQSGYLVSFGAIKGDWEFYANIGAGNNAKVENIGGTGDDYDFQGEIGYQLGAIMNAAGGKAFFEYRGINVNEKDIFDEKWSISKITLGYGREEKMNDIFTAFYKGYLYQDDQKNVAFQDGSDNKETRITAVIGMEAEANSWLTLRGSVSNNLMGEEENEDGDKTTIADAVNVAFGATLKFGDVSLDGLVANDTNADGAGGDDNGNLRSDSLMTRVAMTYNF